MSKREDFKNDLLNGMAENEVNSIMEVFDNCFPVPEIGDIVSVVDQKSILIGRIEDADSKKSTFIGLHDYGIKSEDCRRATKEEAKVYAKRFQEK